MELFNWLEINGLNGEIISPSILKINNKDFFILDSKEELLFDKGFEFILTEEEVEFIVHNNLDSVVFQFGSNWYYSLIEEPKLNLLKYLGQDISCQQELDLPHLGIHGKYEICNGSRDYKDWCIKAKYLGISTIGICETDTLAGTLAFQLACQEANIKSIIGETITVKLKEDYLYKIKLYCQSEQGWRNLLNINAQIKVFNEGFVTEEYVSQHSEGLMCVIDCSTKLFPSFVETYKKIFENRLYYQFDPVEWANSTKELEHLSILKDYITHYSSQIEPVLICDSYYLDKSESHIRKLLNTVGKVGFQNQSYDQYFKSINDIIVQCDELFKDENKSTDFVNILIRNTKALSEQCNFQIKLGELYLPSYELTKEESNQFDSSIDLFWDLIQKGLEEKVLGKVEDEEVYLSRVQEEVRVIEKGGLVDYFLIIWDIINWCEKNDILVSIGRGSAAGCLVSYLLGIVKIDPIPYGLLFERFLSEGRVGKSLPDIDTDVASNRRDDVKRYIESRYGIDHVTSIGTYGTFKMKAAIKDIGKYLGVDFSKTNYITSFLPDDIDFTDIFKIAQVGSKEKSSPLKDFLQKHYQVIENYEAIANQPRTISIHAAGVIITPKSYNNQPMTIYDWIPVKKMDGVLVTEWEGEQLDTAGFLKADVLGIAQLEKFTEIIKLIKQNHGKTISFKDMDLQEEGVYRLFQEGLNEDVFQLGAVGLKSYCKKLKPENIEELIATVALYRPGPMESGAHESFIRIKNGEKEPEYDYMLEEVTKNTHSMYIYQEQVMKAVQILGGLSLIEAEDVRKAMGKKLVDKMEKYRIQFIAGAIKNGCGELDAIRIWNKLEVFAGYGFNKSHAAAYATIGFFCQWLKYTYPIEFWTVSLHYSKQEDIFKRIAEMHKMSDVKVLSPDINNSIDKFKPDFETNTIYWSISSIKQIGEKTMENFLLERNTNGAFFSFEEFYYRIKGKGVNKKAILNLILSGCFDKVEKLKHPTDRIYIIQKFENILNEEVLRELGNSELFSKEYFWILKQKELTGFGYFDFEKIYNSNKETVNGYQYIDPVTLLEPESVGKRVCVVGILSEVVERTVKKTGDKFAPIKLSSNDNLIDCVIWAQIWPEHRDKVLKGLNKVTIITGEVKEPNDYQPVNHVQTNNKSIITFL